MTLDKSEKEILRGAKSGSLADFEKILFLYEGPIFGYVWNLVRIKEDAEDLTQETFLKAYKNIKAIDPERGFKSWIYKIATNTVYDFFRKKKARPESFLIDGENGLETFEDSSTYLDIKDTESLEDLRAAFGEIKPIYKTVLTLFYQKDMEYGEIAETLSLPINTVKTHIYRAKKSLKEKLK